MLRENCAINLSLVTSIEGNRTFSCARCQKLIRKGKGDGTNMDQNVRISNAQLRSYVRETTLHPGSLGISGEILALYTGQWPDQKNA